MLKAGNQRNFLQIWRCSKGVTAIEYALIAGTVATVIIFTVASVGKQLDASFQNTATELSGMPGTGNGGSDASDSGGGSGGSSDTTDNGGGS
ncbi:MAG: Flp family type IVb pilin, partial [Alphaproteobacteria bacterium]